MGTTGFMSRRARPLLATALLATCASLVSVGPTRADAPDAQTFQCPSSASAYQERDLTTPSGALAARAWLFELTGGGVCGVLESVGDYQGKASYLSAKVCRDDPQFRHDGQFDCMEETGAYQSYVSSYYPHSYQAYGDYSMRDASGRWLFQDQTLQSP
jgi:hypothetical protein